MKQRNKILTKSTSGLIVVVLAIMAFVRGPWQVWCLAAAFAVWAIVAIGAIVAWHRKRSQYVRRPVKVRRDENGKSTFKIPDLDDGGSLMLLRHVNHRISAYLKGVCPDSTWEWVTPDPVKEVLQAGEGRIKLFGVQDFNEAMVTFDKHAGIDFHLMRVVPLAVLQGKESEDYDRVPASLPVDVDAWYDVSGKSILEDLVTDLHSRGYNKLVIKGNGDVCVTQGNTEIVQDTLSNMPEAVHWPLLAKVMNKNGLAAAVESTGIVLAW